MRALVTGASGQIGRALIRCAPEGVSVVGLNHNECDICDSSVVAARMREITPDVIINAAAYTAVDRAESETAQAERINVQGVRVLAQTASKLGIRLLHISTDYVFDGKASSPYKADAATSPLGVYGRTKLQGEVAAQSVPGIMLCILRTAWVYSGSGQNFLSTMIRLMRERGRVGVVADQVGTPTAANSVAEVLWNLAETPPALGIFHWTDAGVASWYDFAVAIAEDAAAVGLVPHDVEVTPVTTSEYPTKAQRPAYSVLDKESTVKLLALPQIHWRRRLRDVLAGMVNA